MKVLINSGRTAVFTSTRKKLLEKIITAGHEVYISGFQKEYADELAKMGAIYIEVPFDRAGLNPIEAIKQVRRYKSIVKEYGIEVVHSYTIKPNIFGSIGAYKAGCRRIYPVVNGLGYVFTNTSLKSNLLRIIVSILYKLAFSKTTTVFFQNPDDADEFVKRGIIKKEMCQVVAGSGIDLDAFPDAGERNDVSFLMATRLLKTKGTEYYIRAADIVKGKYPQTQFYLAGSLDPNPDSISKETLDNYVKKGTINYLGHVSNMSATLQKHSVFVLPSYYREGVPHAILEAMSSGCAIITTDWVGCKETVQEGVNGFLVPIKDEKVMADRMIQMIESPEMVKEMGRNSRKIAEEKFDVNKVNYDMTKIMGLLKE